MARFLRDPNLEDCLGSQGLITVLKTIKSCESHGVNDILSPLVTDTMQRHPQTAPCDAG